ncbi:hypothetical protein COOONC_02332 [Cooperia oncophora]
MDFVDVLSPRSAANASNSATHITVSVCCPLLSTSSLPKRAPSNTTEFQQCTILQRVSSTCPTDGFVFCSSAQQTNPTLMQIEFFDANGAVVRTVTGGPPTLVVRVYCVTGVWNVRQTATSTVNVPIASVSQAGEGSPSRNREKSA